MAAAAAPPEKGEVMPSLLTSIVLCFYLLSFFLCICHDIWSRTLPSYLLFGLFLFGVPAFLLRLVSISEPFSFRGILQLMLSFAPGALLLLLGLFSGEAVGLGDGLFFLLSGCYIPGLPLLLILLLGLFTSALVSIGLLVYGRWKGKSMRKRSIPFLPCLIPALPILLRAFPSL